MGAKTSIEWTDASWTPIRARAWEQAGDGVVKERIGWHCEKVSGGCKNCYAEPINRRLGTGLDYKPSHLMRADVSVFLDETMLLAPLKWRKARRIFVCSMTDLFADFVTDEMIDRVFAVMALAPQHTFQVLTKRPERMRAYFEALFWNPDRDTQSKLAVARLGGDLTASLEAAVRLEGMPLPNVWLGVSVEDQDAANARVPALLATPAAVRFVSAEPLLGPIWLSVVSADRKNMWNWLTGETGRMYQDGPDFDPGPSIQWVICGGESGPDARPMHPDWARSLRDQCADAKVPFFFKQWGEWVPAGPAYPDEVEATVEQRDAWENAIIELPGPHTGRVCCMNPEGDMPVDYRYVGEYQPGSGSWWLERVGKKAAGRLLDGVTHDGVPA